MGNEPLGGAGERDVYRQFDCLGNPATWGSQIGTNAQDPHALGTAVIAGAVAFLAAATCVEACPALATAAVRQATYVRYMYVAETGDVSTGVDTTVLYSGPGNEAAAEEFAAGLGRTTIGGTRAGAFLRSDQAAGRLNLLSRDQTGLIWARLSERLAAQASGEVVAFAEGAKEEGIFLTIEYPGLLRNPAVSLIAWGG